MQFQAAVQSCGLLVGRCCAFSFLALVGVMPAVEVNNLMFVQLTFWFSVTSAIAICIRG